MIVHDLDVQGPLSCPGKTYSVLIVDADTVLSHSITSKRFQPITGRDPQIIEFFGSVEHRKLSHRNNLNIHKALDTFTAKQPFRINALERPYWHKQNTNATR